MIKIVQPIVEQEEIDGAVEVLKSGTIAQGPVTAEFEREFAEICGAKFAVATTNGTTALHAALFGAGIKPGDGVITTPFTFVATANSILMQGASPVFADIDADTYLIDPDGVAKAVTPKTKAIMPVDLYGQPVDFAALSKIAKDSSLLIIDDACQAIGAKFDGKAIGSIGDAACFSLYATKNITTGEGGMITTNSPEIAERARQFRHHGQSQRYEYVGLGYNYRTTDIASAIGRAQLKKLERFTLARQKNASYYLDKLKDIKGLTLPKTAANRTHVYHQFTIRVTKDFSMTRDALIEFLKTKDIMAGVYYPKPLHLFPQFKGLGYKQGSFPNAELAAKEVISLPVHPLLTKEEKETIVKAIYQAAKEKRK